MLSVNESDLTHYLVDESTFSTSLLVIAVDRYGLEALSWEPETLIRELEEDFNTQIPQSNRDKLNAIITILTTNSFYSDPLVFWQITKAINGESVSWLNEHDPLTSDECAWAMIEISLNEGETQEMGEDIRVMVGELLRTEGFVRPPKFLNWAIMPESSVAGDRAADEAKEKRQENLKEDLEETMRELLTQLDAELSEVTSKTSTRPEHSDQTLVERTLANQRRAHK